MKIKGLIFDFGFTLFNFRDVSVEKYLDCYKAGLTKSLERLTELNVLNDMTPREKMIKTFNNKRAEYFRDSVRTKKEYKTSLIFKETFEKYDVIELDDEILDELAFIYHSCERDEWVPFQYTRETLKSLKNVKKIKLAVLSNHPHHGTIENLLQKYDLRKFFDAVVTSAEYGKRKPDPGIFHYTIQKMGLKSPKYCMVCGDEYADISGGNKVGLKTILCTRTFKFPFEKEVKDQEFIKVNDISEVIKYID